MLGAVNDNTAISIMFVFSFIVTLHERYLVAGIALDKHHGTVNFDIATPL